ncbi:MAG: MFS transporter [Candidatus Nanopelagicales bacterium]
MAPRHDHKPGQGRSISSMLRPLKEVRVWRFSLYYVIVFGAYVALAAWLPKYYVDVYGLALPQAGLLTALFIFPASLLRPVGGYISDRIGARKVMYATFGTMLVASGILMMPYGYIVLQQPGGEAKQVLPWTVGVVLFTVLVFIIGCAMGIGKAAVYKHIPEYFPHDVGAVGGLVGSLGALGGFFLPPLFAYASAWSGRPAGHVRRALPDHAHRDSVDALDSRCTMLHIGHAPSWRTSSRRKARAPKRGLTPTPECPAAPSDDSGSSPDSPAPTTAQKGIRVMTTQPAAAPVRRGKDWLHELGSRGFRAHGTRVGPGRPCPSPPSR